MKNIKTLDQFLDKLRITELNKMQNEALQEIPINKNTMILSPTGTGKTLSFLLPLIDLLDLSISGVQHLVVVPTRELAIQIEQVLRNLGAGIKVSLVYGGKDFSKEKEDLINPPLILIGTPGRIADHLRRSSFDTNFIHAIVLDEFDKSLEIGFEEDMKDVISYLHSYKKMILTSATVMKYIPEYLNFKNFKKIDYLKNSSNDLEIKLIDSKLDSKPNTLLKTLSFLGKKKGIIFCNFKDDIKELSDFLNKKHIEHGCFYGGLEQKDRERVLIKFRNSSYQCIIATDLAARGIDISELDYIIHYQLPMKESEFIHRNGRTARMGKQGAAYVLVSSSDKARDYLQSKQFIELKTESHIESPVWKTIFISGGRKDKISKSDIVGIVLKQGQLKTEHLGLIELKQDCAFVAIHQSQINHIIQSLNNQRLKKKKIRVYEV